MSLRATLLAALLGVGLCISCASKPDPNRATPKLTARTLICGLADGDKSVVRSCVVADGDQRKVADGMLALTHGMHHATSAVEKRWHQPIVQVLGGPLDLTRLNNSMIDSGKESIAGDTAMLELQLLTLNMVQQKGGWRIDLIKSIGVDEQMIQYALPIFSAMGNACNEVAGEIDAGKHASYADAMTALQSRISAAMQEESRRAAMKALRSGLFWP